VNVAVPTNTHAAQVHALHIDAVAEQSGVVVS